MLHTVATTTDRHRFLRRACGVTTFFAVLTVVMTWPLALTAGTHGLAEGADMRLFIWTLAWNVHALVTQPLALFDANIFHPARQTLAYSENLFGVALVAAPWIALTGNPLLGLNVAVLLSCLLSGVGTYVLARQLGIGTGAALAAGVVFAFAPARFFRISQLHLTMMPWIPFCLALLHRYLDGGGRAALLGALALFTLQALSSGHGALFLGVAVGALVIYHAVVVSRPSVRKIARDVGIAGVLVLAINVPFVLPYLQLKRDEGLHRTIENLETWSPNAVSYLASPTYVHQAVLERLPGGLEIKQARAFLFPGWITLALAAAALWPRRHAWREAVRLPADHRGGLVLVCYALLACAALWASLGPQFGLYRLLYHLPGFGFIRVPSRLMILVLLCLAVLAGAGVDRLCRRLAPSARVWVAGAVLLVMAAEFTAIPLRTYALPMEIPAVDRWLAGQPKPFVIAEVPVLHPRHVRQSRLQALYMLHSRVHWQPTVNGYSGFKPRRLMDLHARLSAFPDEASLRALERVGVTYVVVHLDYYRAEERVEVEQALERWRSRLRLEYEQEDGRVYRLLPAADASISAGATADRATSP